MIAELIIYVLGCSGMAFFTLIVYLLVSEANLETTKEEAETIVLLMLVSALVGYFIINLLLNTIIQSQ